MSPERKTADGIRKYELDMAVAREALTVMAQGMVVLEGGVIVFVNEPAATMLEVSPRLLEPGLMWRPVLDNTWRGVVSMDRDLMARVYRADHDNLPITFERQTMSGRTLRVDARPRQGGGRLLTYTDITETKRRERELQRAMNAAKAADQAKSEFLATMSHELRTPMNGVMGIAELLAMTTLDDRQKTYADIILRSGQALTTVIDDILDFSKIESGQIVLEDCTFDLIDAIEDIVALVSPKGTAKGLSLRFAPHPEHPRLYRGDVGRIRTVLTNLVENAVEFTAKGHVSIDLRYQPGQVGIMIRVMDTGIGIPADKTDHIFERFSQVDQSYSRSHEGAGLGLAISKKLVVLMGGEIGVRSDLGHGSEFWFTLPLAVAREQDDETS